MLQLAEAVRSSRCRKISLKEANKIIEEIGEETLHGQIAMDELLRSFMDGRKNDL